MSFGELGKPFSDGKAYFREKGKVNKKVWYGLLGVVIALPILLIAAGLLSSADAVFRKMTTDFMNWIRPDNIFNVVIRVTFLFFTSYALTSYLCKRSIPEEVKDRRKGEPVLAITIMSLLSLLYLLFSGIQIFGLFLGKCSCRRAILTHSMQERAFPAAGCQHSEPDPGIGVPKLF